MQKKWKKTGAALLIAGLTVTGTSYAWANEKASEPIDLSELTEDSTTDVVESPETVEVPIEEDAVNEEETIVEDETNQEETEGADDTEGAEDDIDEVEESVLPEIPEGYTAGNLAALGKAYEKVQNPTAKAAIKRNMERSIEKWENKQQKVEAPEQPEVIVEEPVKEEAPVIEEPVKQETPVKRGNPDNVKQEKAPQAQLNAQHKEQRQELKTNQKAEREALKIERKADKEQQKQEKKDKKN